MAKRTLTVTAPDGTVLTRTTARDYKWAVLARRSDGELDGQWVRHGVDPRWVASWTTRRELAEKQAASDRTASLLSDIVIVPVNA